MMRITMLFLSLTIVVPSLASATVDPAPASLNDLRVDQHLGAQLPLDLPFNDEHGNAVTLRDCLHGRPAVLSLVYFQCPMLCTMTLNQLDRSLNAISESAGDKFELVTISFDPRETPELAAAKKLNYLRSYRRPTADAGWHFLTGHASSIDQLTDTVGFHYRWDAANGMFAHPSVLIVLTPDGRVSRYFLGVEYPPTELQTAIREAAAGKIAAASESVYFYCMRYDPRSGRYSFIISRALRVLGGATAIGIVVMIVLLHHASVRRARLTGLAT